MKYKILNKKNKKKVINYLNSRFGISKDIFENKLFFTKRKGVYLINNYYKKNIIKKFIKNNKIENLGLEIISNLKRLIPCSLGFTSFNIKEIKLNYVIVNRKTAIKYFKKKKIDLKNTLHHNILSNGYIILIYNKKIIGTGEIKENRIYANKIYVDKKIK